jgi:hypothetical protein
MKTQYLTVEVSDVLDVNDGADGEEGDEEGDEAEEEEESPYWVKLLDTRDSYQCLIGDCKRILSNKGSVNRHIGNVHKAAIGTHQRGQMRVRAGGNENEN